jgi:hypothetical protein
LKSTKKNKLKHLIKWFEVAISIDLDNLQDYSDTLEKLIYMRKVKFKEDINKQAAEIEEEYRDEFYEYHSSEYWQLDEVFPSLLRSTLFIACYSCLEDNLVGLCSQLHKKMKLVKEPKFHSGIIFTAKVYLETDACIKLPAEMPAWEKICFYNILRNALVHNSGKLDIGKLDEEKRSRFQSFLDATTSISLNQSNVIQLAPEFCPGVIKTIRDFFHRELIPAIPDIELD